MRWESPSRTGRKLSFATPLLPIIDMLKETKNHLCQIISAQERTSQVDNYLLVNAGDISSVLGLGGFHLPQGN